MLWVGTKYQHACRNLLVFLDRRVPLTSQPFRKVEGFSFSPSLCPSQSLTKKVSAEVIKFQDNKKWSGVKPKPRPLKGTCVCLLRNCFAEGRKMFVSVSYLWSSLTKGHPSAVMAGNEGPSNISYSGTESLTMAPWHPSDNQNYLGSIGQYIQSQEDNTEINRDLPIDFTAPSNEAFRAYDSHPYYQTVFLSVQHTLRIKTKP